MLTKMMNKYYRLFGMKIEKPCLFWTWMLVLMGIYTASIIEIEKNRFTSVQ